jgi:predicted DNA-binding ArsR family transcriptional regulator
MAITVNKVDKESGEAVSASYYAASEITLSSDWRIVNLLRNAKPKTTDVTSTSVKFKCAKGQLTYIVPFKFMSDDQLKVVSVIVDNQLKRKK